jgi:prepilin-type N-terminal cleavage/methylation domain-containing protein
MRKPNQTGFTLVELLVVIAIIAVLAGLVMTAITRSQFQARLTACTNNLKQFGAAIEIYKTEYEGRMPNWLSSMLGSQAGGDPSLYRCPNDGMNGKEGGRADWITDGQYAETNDLCSDTDDVKPEGARTFTDVDQAALGITRKTAGYRLAAANEQEINQYKADGCSYLYEFNGEECSWYTGGYGTIPVGASWQEVKLYEASGKTEDVDGAKVVGGRVPVIRCFYHINEVGGGHLTDDNESKVLNLRYANNVSISYPKSWWK